MAERVAAPGRRVRRHAVVSEEAAYAIAKKFGPQIREFAQRVRLSDEALARALHEALEQLDGIGRQWFADARTEEVAEEVLPLGRELTSGEAAELLGLTGRQVTKLADAGVLAGRKPRGRWRIDEASVLAYRRRRTA